MTYPERLEITVRLNAFGAPCFIQSVRDQSNGENCSDAFKEEE